VFLAYASEKGVAFIDRALYLPREWTEDPERRTEAGVPGEIAFENKIELTKRMLERAFGAKVPAKWVAGDSFYGRSHEFREWLEGQGCSYAVMVPKTNAVPLGASLARRRSSSSPSGCTRMLGRRSIPWEIAAEGMRVLDVGSGAGDVALLADELVGPTGSVVGVDQDPRILRTASARTETVASGGVSKAPDLVGAWVRKR